VHEADDDPTALDLAVGQRGRHVRAAVLDRAQAVGHPEDRHASSIELYRPPATRREVIQRADVDEVGVHGYQSKAM
jgi:hypothetical protein